MPIGWDIIQANAMGFVKKWNKASNEEAEAQLFITNFLWVFGIEDPLSVGAFEYRIPLSEGKSGYVDYFWKTKIAIEMKSKGRNLDLAYTQLRNYMLNVVQDDVPDLWMVCDFENIRVYRRSTSEIFEFKTKSLHKNIKRFADIAGYTTERVREDQTEVNIKAAEKMAKLHDALKESGYTGHNLEIYLVRLLFCLFANDTGIFPKDNFLRYIEDSKIDGSDLSDRITRLFEVLNIPEEIRSRRTLLSNELKQFRYINGKLFEVVLPTAEFDAKMRQLLLDCIDFDWSIISPAIFGAMFQGVMDAKTRRELGAHYTSEENILKLINPLFMDDLWKEFDRVKTDPIQLRRFHNRISKMRFLDPACGCGNFLIITYRELRLLEIEILKMMVGNQTTIDIIPLLKIGVEQFYGIEYEDFPCQIAQVGMWLMDHQMNLRISEQFGLYYARLPLSQSATIVQGNALKLDWDDIVNKYELSYILGNPPFNGARTMNQEQKEDMAYVFKGLKGMGNLDYVTAWYKKSIDLIKYTNIRVAFVSTNSISQGEQPAILWKQFINIIKIDYAYRTFKWSNDAKGKAAVHCIIIGFSGKENELKKIIYDNDKKIEVKNINPYLVDAANIFIEARSKPLCDVPEMNFGSMPNDGKGLLSKYTTEQKNEIINKHPETEKWFKKIIGADEFINNRERWCLWLYKEQPSEIAKSIFLKNILDRIRDERRKSSRDGTRKLADTPYLFGEIRQPITEYLTIPKTSSENRRYIPIGFLKPNVIATDALFTISNVSLYHFGILTSNVHMAWTRAVCGRLKSDYRYSNMLVYNNFIWPNCSGEQKQKIEELAQGVLNARMLFSTSSLADLYDSRIMPIELIKSHRALDSAVQRLYGFPVNAQFTETHCVAALMERYQKLVNNINDEH